MDREIDTRTRYRALLKRLLVPAAVIASVGLLLSWGTGLLRPSVKRSSIRTAVVDQGPVDACLSATGTVVPETEQVLSSPVDARLHARAQEGRDRGERRRSDRRTGRERIGARGRVSWARTWRSRAISRRGRSWRSRTRSPSSTRSSRSRHCSWSPRSLEHVRNKQLFEKGLTSSEDAAPVRGRRAPGGHRTAAHRSLAPNAQAVDEDRTRRPRARAGEARRRTHQEARRVLGLATPTRRSERRRHLDAHRGGRGRPQGRHRGAASPI